MVITVIAREWFDKTYGNSYFTAVCYADDKVLELPFQGGYGDHYKDMAFKAMEEAQMLPAPVERSKNGSEALWQYCRRNNITLNTEKICVARKKDM